MYEGAKQSMPVVKQHLEKAENLAHNLMGELNPDEQLEFLQKTHEVLKSIHAKHLAELTMQLEQAQNTINKFS